MPTATSKTSDEPGCCLSDDELYAACRSNGRATKTAMAARDEALVRIATDIQPCTVRQVFYQATVWGVVEKTEAGYDQVQRALVRLRNSKRISFSWIIDNTRWQIKPRSYDRVADALEDTARLYRRAVWSDLDVHVEIWLEKDALTGVVQPITAKYDVGLLVARGFSSITFLYANAAEIIALDKPAYIYHLGDHDPSGVCARQKIEQKLREFAPGAHIHFEPLAVLPEQIQQWQLPARATKKSDSRAKNFQGDSVELDAIRPDELRNLVEQAITAHLPAQHLDVLRIAQQRERAALRMIARQVSP